jgi:hypothetical protein
VLVSLTSQALAEECAGFVSWVAPAKDAYFQKHRIYPIPDHIQELAKQYMPRLWVHPQSWQPIDFDEYLAKSKLVRKRDKSILKTAPSARYLANLDHEEQCSLYLDAGEITPDNPAPIYIQAFWDENPADPDEQWTYIKYNLVFDWSGLAAEVSWPKPPSSAHPGSAQSPADLLAASGLPRRSKTAFGGGISQQ